MPLLDFQCSQCEKKFDELVYSSEMDKVKCPECGSRDVKRIYEGKCYFGMLGGSSNSGGCSARSCSGCSGCGH
ncbi:MAG: zinc ribbon domain-containing protein [Clostridiales bacterium]|jgi:putative FmdB family regulatory protein|nr:zinc ribbon domain-containing protein [Clostridiales bacterium]